MPNPYLTRRMAYLAAQDAATRNMRKHGRTFWSDDDYLIACEEFERLWPEDEDAAKAS